MPDLGILEILIVFFLFMPLAQPYIKTFHTIKGLNYFPLIALFCTVAIFPAYGFRPECLPLFVFTLVYYRINSLRIKRATPHSVYTERSPLYFICILFFIVGTSFIAIYFLPLTDSRVFSYTEIEKKYDPGRNNEYFTKVYNKKTGNEFEGEKAALSGRPLVLVIPPLTGSGFIVDRVCRALSEQGILVLNASRAGLDIPPEKGVDIKTYYPVIPEYIKRLGSSVWKNPDTYKAACFFEKERMADIEFLLPLLTKQFKSNEVYLLAYDEGASAAILLSGSDNFFENNPALKGIIAVGPRLYSNFQLEELRHSDDEEPQEGAHFFVKKWIEIKNRIKSIKRYKLAHTGKSASPRFPLLVLASERTGNPRYAEGEYAALVSFLREHARDMSVLTMNGAGAYAYSDVPEKYPVISALANISGNRSWDNKESVSNTAQLIYRFVEQQRTLEKEQ
ncbi:MAG: hypothetical protein LBV68_06545 [Spirochaetaceae bacterium]|jgi:hypothetical protein|nr:hypothetical protein [Spirochaetaceae bacterium]